MTRRTAIREMERLAEKYAWDPKLQVEVEEVHVDSGIYRVEVWHYGIRTAGSLIYAAEKQAYLENVPGAVERFYKRLGPNYANRLRAKQAGNRL